MRALKLKLLLSLAVGAALMVASLWDTPLRAVGRAIASADPWRMAGYAAILVCIHLVRTVRWGILLEPLGHVGFKRLNSASAVGFMLLMVLPFRLGEFARPLLIARPPPGGVGPTLRRSGAFASIVVERIVDGLAIGLLGFFVLCVAVTGAFFLRDRAVQLVSALLRPFSPRLAQRASSTTGAFISALHLGSGWKALAFFVLTAVYWSLNGFGLALLAPAFGFHLAPLWVATILAVQVVGVMVPAGPGMIGTTQFFTQAALSLFVSDAANAAGYANALWMLNFGVQVALGLLFMLLGHVSLRGVLQARPETDTDADLPAPASS